MKELENKSVEFKCRMCGYYYEAKAKLCVLERRCPNCGYLNREPDLDVKRRVILEWRGLLDEQ